MFAATWMTALALSWLAVLVALRRAEQRDRAEAVAELRRGIEELRRAALRRLAGELVARARGDWF